MIETISAKENLVVNRGEEPGSSRPPSSQDVIGSKSDTPSQTAVEVDLRAEIVRDVGKNSERVSNSPKSEKSLEEDLKKTIEALNDKLTRLDREVLFKMDKRINKNYISVIDKQSKEVIREFPPKEIRTFIARFDEFNDMLTSSADVKSMIINLEV
jgi:flagellar protein FlaG